MVNISIYVTLNKTARPLKQKQIWKNRIITKARSNGMKNSQANLRRSASFDVVLFPQHEKKSITVDLSYFSRTFWENIWKVAYGNGWLKSSISKENSALKFCISLITTFWYRQLYSPISFYIFMTRSRYSPTSNMSYECNVWIWWMFSYIFWGKM